MLVSFVIFVLGGFATPARADALGQLCTMAGASDCPSYPTYTPTERYQPDRPDRRCYECEERDRAALADSWAHLSHPVPALAMSANLGMILTEDCAAAELVMAGAESALAVVLAAPALEIAVTVGLGYLVYNAITRPGAFAPPLSSPIPRWLDQIGLSLAAIQSSAAGKTCAELAAALAAACAADPPECSPGDSCEQRQAKRAASLPCDQARLDLVDRTDCDAQKSEGERLALKSRRALSECSRLIRDDHQCCDPSVREATETLCKTIGKLNCDNEGRVTMRVLRSPFPSRAIPATPAADAMALCASATAKSTAGKACLAAREAERDRCFNGVYDAGHAKEARGVAGSVKSCDEFLDEARWLGLCR